MLDRPETVKITRPHVLQSLLNLYREPSYLEIGVARGDTFHAISAPRKVAVDPRFVFDVAAAKEHNPGAIYHRVTSDEYFSSIIAPNDRFQLIYLDGLHTSEQTLRDLLNGVHYLANDGVIVIDDAIPKNYAASLVDRQEANAVRSALNIKGGAWMGDLYRLVFFIETYLQQFSYRTISDNHGQIVLWRESRPTLPSRTLEEIGRLEFKSLFTEREAFRFAKLDEILTALCQRHDLLDVT